MFDFLIRKSSIKNAQKFIDRLDPKVQVHVPEELPLPSVAVLKKLCATVSRINGLEEAMARLSDDELRAKTATFREGYQKAVAADQKNCDDIFETYTRAVQPEEKEDLGLKVERAREQLRKVKQEYLEAILPEAFAVAREAGKRVLNMRHFDVQLVGGMVLNNGNIAEMTTGEGKTLVATLPAYLNGLTGEGVHVVTVNDYLARRDCEWMGPLYEFLGLTIGVIQHDMMPAQRKVAYACDITYGTNNEFGFDYLRDNMVNHKNDMVQRPHHFAIVDEVDSILIDESRTPLIISGPAEESTDKYYRANEVTKSMKGRRITERDEIDAKHQEVDLGEGFDYLADEKARAISLTDSGEEKAAQLFGVENLHDMDTIEYRHHILQALKAREFFKIDVDYVVREGEVIIVDEFTGRMMPGRRWSDGLHQAVEAKEGIKIARENQTLATITFQNYFRLYEKLSGMTGTADTEATEFKQIYDLDVVVIPTNKVLQRKNFADQIYKTVGEKFKAVVDEIEEFNKRGQPVLVGTISIEKSELLSRLLTERGVPHKVLNAKFHEQEANIIAQAGHLGAVTIATNMAGRGTDIVLGGNAEFLAKSLLDQKSSDEDDPQKKAELLEKFIEQFREKVREEHVKVKELGGLHVLGTERHESRRIDNQLRGRQGRQGDPGSSKFFVSLEDDLMRLFASDKMVGLMDKLGMEEGQVLEHPWLTRAIENAQKRVEGHNFEIRKHLLEYDNVMNRQREVIYDLRRVVLEGTDIKYMITEAMDEAVDLAVEQYLFAQTEEMSWDVEGLGVYLHDKFGYTLSRSSDEMKDMDQPQIAEDIRREVHALYEAKEQEIGVEQLRFMERMVMLHTIDSKWKEHLYAMDQLKDGIGLRSFAQRDPLIEYKKEGFLMFQEMYTSVKQEVAEVIFKIQPAQRETPLPGVFSSLPQQMIHQEAAGLGSQPQAPKSPPPTQPAARPSPPPSPPSSAAMAGQRRGEKVGRNDPCPCGSGKKYKKCCGQ